MMIFYLSFTSLWRKIFVLPKLEEVLILDRAESICGPLHQRAIQIMTLETEQ